MGVDGEYEHAAAILHPTLGTPFRAAGARGQGDHSLGQEAGRARHDHRRAAPLQGRGLRPHPLRRDGGAARRRAQARTRSWSPSSSPTAGAPIPASAASPSPRPRRRTVSDERQRREEAKPQADRSRGDALKKDVRHSRRRRKHRRRQHQVRPRLPSFALGPDRVARRDGRVPAAGGGPGLRLRGVHRPPPADPARLRVHLARAGGAARGPGRRDPHHQARHHGAGAAAPQPGLLREGVGHARPRSRAGAASWAWAWAGTRRSSGSWACRTRSAAGAWTRCWRR